MRFLSLLTIHVAILAVATGCGPEPTPPASQETPTMVEPKIESVLWRLEELRGESGDMTAVLPQTTVDVTFEGGRLGGSAGCNRYFGSYRLEEGNRLTVSSEMGSTQMACAPEVLAQEQRYLALLGQVATITREGDHLFLQDADSVRLLEFLATEPASLETTRWQATGINNGKGGVVSTATTSLSTAVFVEGQLNGSGGCNQFTADYEVEGDRITIGPAAATRKFCDEPEGIMDQEQQYFEALGRATIFSLTPESLELRDEDGSLQVSFRIAVNQEQPQEISQ